MMVECILDIYGLRLVLNEIDRRRILDDPSDGYAAVAVYQKKS